MLRFGFKAMGEIQCNRCRPSLNYPKGIASRCQPVSAVRELVPPGGQLPAHMVLMMICGKELWVPLDREIARQMASILAPFRDDSGSESYARGQ
jgi:hypothetical protein